MTQPQTADEASALFEQMTGHAPEAMFSAPGRVNLIGEHTDYNDGFVFPFAIDHRTVVAAGRRDDNVIRVVSTFDETPAQAELTDLDGLFPARRGDIAEWARYPLGVAWALLASTDAPIGLDLAIASDVPVGAGLSSSAAIEGATAMALNTLWQIGADRPTLARAGRRAENEAVGAPTGIMDQMASMLGEPDAGVFLDCRSLEAHVIHLGFAEAGLDVLVMDTKVAHAHSTGGYAERRASCERGAAAMGVSALRDVSVRDLDRAAQVMDAETFRRVRHIVTENQRVLDTVRTLRDEGPRAIGSLLDASHASMRDDFEISTPELDLAVETARAAGAIGARMTGGGFGGAAIALVSRELIPEVTDAVAAAFAKAGFGAPVQFTVTASGGARQDR